MNWNKDIFIKNIEYLINTYCNGVAKEFNTRIDQRDAYTRWKKSEVKPNLEAIFTICEKFECDFNWLLTGEGTPKNVFGIEFSEQFIEMHKKIEDILTSGTDYADTLQQNINALHTAVKKEKESEKDIAALKKRMREEIKEELREEFREEAAKLIKNQINEHQKKFSHKGFAVHTGTDEGDGTEN